MVHVVEGDSIWPEVEGDGREYAIGKVVLEAVVALV